MRKRRADEQGANLRSHSADQADRGRIDRRLRGSLGRCRLALSEVRGANAAAAPAGRAQAILESLIDERRRLRGDRDDASLLEANRIAIVYWQQQLERSRTGAPRRARPGV
jgi:hypothetical protein